MKRESMTGLPAHRMTKLHKRIKISKKQSVEMKLPKKDLSMRDLLNQSKGSMSAKRDSLQMSVRRESLQMKKKPSEAVSVKSSMGGR